MAFDVPAALARRRIARAGAALLVLAVAAVAQYKVTNYVRPVSLESTGKFAPATVTLGQEELIIEGPLVSVKDRLLLSGEGRPDEILDLSFDRARLADKTVEEFQSVGLNPPAAPAGIVYQAEDSARPPVGDKSCRTIVELRVASKLPDRLRLYQLNEPGRARQRRIELIAEGADLTASFATMQPGDSPRAPGCQKVLRVGDGWSQSVSDIPIETVVSAGSALQFSFLPLGADAAWGGAEGFFEPFDLGAESATGGPPAFQARAVHISPRRGRTAGAAAPARLIAESARGGPPLTVYGLKVGAGRLQISVAGTGLVQADGEYVTVNLLSGVFDNTISYLLLGAANLALLGWASRMIFRKPHPSPPGERPIA